MEPQHGRFQRADQATEERRELRVEVLALRRELELLEEAQHNSGTSLSARAALERAFDALRGAETAWRNARKPSDLLKVVTELEVARQALDASLDAQDRGRHDPRAARYGS